MRQRRRRLLGAVLLVASPSFGACAGKAKPATLEPPPDTSAPISSLAVGLARAGGNVGYPTQTKRVEPIYPPASKQARDQGMVYLEVIVGDTGNVTHVTIVRAPTPALGDAAATAVRQWEYAPTILEGRPVPVVMIVMVSFRLTGGA